MSLLSRRSLMMNMEDEEMSVYSGSFEIAEDAAEYTVSGLGFTPTNVIICEDGFETISKRTSVWIMTDVFSATGRYTADNSAAPSILNTSTQNENALVEIIEGGFKVKQASSNYPIAPKTYKFIAW